MGLPTSTDQMHFCNHKMLGRWAVLLKGLTSSVLFDRLEAVMYSLTAAAKELLHMRAPALADLQLACAAASLACAKPSNSPSSSPLQVCSQSLQAAPLAHCCRTHWHEFARVCLSSVLQLPT